jgi:hypothetical protein
MMLTDGDAKVIAAAMGEAAIAHDQAAKKMQAAGKAEEAAKHAAFSMECARLADLFHKRH